MVNMFCINTAVQCVYSAAVSLRSGRGSLCAKKRVPNSAPRGENLREELFVWKVALVDCPLPSLAERRSRLQREEQVYLHFMLYEYSIQYERTAHISRSGAVGVRGKKCADGYHVI